MTFPQWIAAVQEIARTRNLLLTTTPVTGPEGQNWVSFNWVARNNSRYGSSGAGAELIHLTSPLEFTWDWYAGPDPVPNVPPPPVHPPVVVVPPNPWERHGRFVPRVPAMAVSDALIALFKLGAV